MIERDKAFGSLLLKIKQAYTDFIQGSEGNSTIEQMQQLLSLTNEENAAIKKVNTELLGQQQESKQRLKDRDSTVKELSAQIESLNNKVSTMNQTIEKLKATKVNQKASFVSSKFKNTSQKASSADGFELSQSCTSARNELPCEGPIDDITKQKLIRKKMDSIMSPEASDSDEIRNQNEQLLDDVNTLVQQNFELNQGLNQMNDEIQYLKLREKKLKYLIHLLHERGYPVH